MRPQQNTHNEFEEKIIQISRVSKKTKGGNTIGFSILMVVGDRKGKVGVGLGKAPEVAAAIRKGVKKAKKKMISVPLDGTTIPFPLTIKLGAATVLLKPAPRGSGVIAGGPVRAVVEAAGIRDISSKILGTQNQASNAYATFAALTQIKQMVELKGIELKSIAQVEAEEERKVRDEMAQKQERREASKTAKSKESTKPTAVAPKKPVSAKAAPKQSAASTQSAAPSKTASAQPKKAATTKNTPAAATKSK